MVGRAGGGDVGKYSSEFADRFAGGYKLTLSHGCGG